jgi:hypothetical protein
MNSAADFYMTLEAIPCAQASKAHSTATEAPGVAQSTVVADDQLP